MTNQSPSFPTIDIPTINPTDFPELDDDFDSIYEDDPLFDDWTEFDDELDDEQL